MNYLYHSTINWSRYEINDLLIEFKDVPVFYYNEGYKKVTNILTLL